MEGDVEREAARPREGGGVAAGDVVLFEDEDLVPLAGEGRGRTEAAQAGADDDGVVSARRGLVLAAAGKGVPIPAEEREPGQERFEEIPSVPCVFRHRGVSLISLSYNWPKFTPGEKESQFDKERRSFSAWAR